jgi:hypothetical protein
MSAPISTFWSAAAAASRHASHINKHLPHK